MLKFAINSSSGDDLYIVTFSREGGNMTATCTCAAAKYGMACKHRLNLLYGDITDVESGDTDLMHTLLEMFAQSDVETALADLTALETQKKDIDRQIKAAKKRLGTALAD